MFFFKVMQKLDVKEKIYTSGFLCFADLDLISLAHVVQCCGFQSQELDFSQSLIY